MSEFQDILVAIHGIGDQSRNSTVRSVATRLAHSSISVARADDVPPVSPQPLGWFYTDVRGAVRVAPLDKFDSPSHPLAGVGFTEVFWADIPQEVVSEGRTLEETKAWARTVVARARAVCKRKVRILTDVKEQRPLTDAEQLQMVEPDFSLAAEVLEEIIDTVYVLENLLFVAKKAGVFQFDLKRVLDEYLGDVQIMTEFTLFRHDIIGRFHSAMRQIHAAHPQARLHIVAHSEGTVVSFLGLLHALSGQRLLPASGSGDAVLDRWNRVPPWLEKLEGFMTIGSPIDKHILIWPQLFDDFEFTPACPLYQKRAPIKWRNYYDYGDPIGFKLNTARAWLACHHECQPFEFSEKNDIGFARYLLPGKAHNDYWDDPLVFEHFIQDVVKSNPDPAQPKTRPLVSLLSPVIPYLVSLLLLITGTYILYRAVAAYIHPDLEPLQRYVRFKVLGLAETPGGSPLRMLANATAIAGLLAGVTLFARLPRLAAGARWFFWGSVAFFLGCLSYGFGVNGDARLEIGQIFQPWGGETAATFGVLLLALLVGLLALLVLVPSHEFGRAHVPSRKQRWFRRGMRPLIYCGALGILVLIVGQVVPHSALTPEERGLLTKANPQEVAEIDRAHLNRADLDKLLKDEKGAFRDPGLRHIQTASRVLTVRPPLWPMLLGGAAFLYLWWLAALIFDLGFVWQRYIRQARGHERLMLWSGYQPPAPEAGSAPPTTAPG